MFWIQTTYRRAVMRDVPAPQEDLPRMLAALSGQHAHRELDHFEDRPALLEVEQSILVIANEKYGDREGIMLMYQDGDEASNLVLQETLASFARKIGVTWQEPAFPEVFTKAFEDTPPLP